MNWVSARSLSVTTSMLAVLIAAALSLALALPALGHDQLIAHSPAAGEELDRAPTAVTLTFTATPLDVSAIVMIVDADDKDWAAGDPRIGNNEVVQDPAGPLPGGNYEVRWRIVSSDGHPISGTFLFSVGPSTDAKPVPRPGTSEEQAPALNEMNDDQLAAVSPREAQIEGQGRGLRIGLFAGGGALLGVVVFLLARFIFIRPTSTTPQSEGTPQ